MNPSAQREIAKIDEYLRKRADDVRRAKLANAALGWLSQYGEDATKEGSPFRVEVSPGFASARAGYDEAVDYMETAARSLAYQILCIATANAKEHLDAALHASGIEAPSGGETRSGSTEGESPAPEGGDAPPQSGEPLTPAIDEYLGEK